MRKADCEKLVAFENNCARRVLQIPWTAKMTNEDVWKKLEELPGLLQHTKTRKLRYFGHVIRSDKATVENAVMTGLVPGVRSRGRPAAAWIDNIPEWTGLKGTQLLGAACDRCFWSSFSHHCCAQPSTSKTG